MKSVLAYTTLLASLVAGHVSFISPCPRYSSVGKNCPSVPSGQTIDTNMNAPISSVQQNYADPICKHTVPWPTPAATWTAGKSVTIDFNPVAAVHSGGHCQFSISYDGGKTFAVIHEELQYCFLGSKPSGNTNTAKILSYTFQLPSNLPSSDSAVFAWSWVNASGNREFYMNCADVKIEGGSSSSYSGKQMVIANYPGYPTIPEFNGDYSTGLQYYTGASNVTVSPGGSSSSGSGSGSGSGSSAAGGSSAAASAGASAAPASSAPAAYSSAPVATTAAGDASPVAHEAAGASSTGAVDDAGADTDLTDATDATDAAGAESDTEEATAAAGAGTPGAGSGTEAAAGASSGGGSCTSGLMQCSGSGYQICNGGVWSPVYDCGVGATCLGDSGHIYCGWASSSAN
ncbi:hypothetical protein GGI25_003631 [Coemansia spiralis]|uniref:Chitin-binding type-4 domain-containing protein n=2 Tax=Coemansia TaxID=4863 RepID=A0A9W8G861_9FUNG|nr:hypothetical protein EDC05_000031 [Coemansia umbellata]KAJ2626102.1 hypothetical protein GGI26_000186 [Coemansia sp. RSA 1358]KAJ2676244.1 hypothetical protein GGI25_003631 [Coemansia spiralis]